MTGAQAHAPSPAPAARGLLARAGRVLAVLALPASILPVLVLGPAMLRAPEKVWLQARPHVRGPATVPGAGRAHAAAPPELAAQPAPALRPPAPAAASTSPTTVALRR